MDAGAMGAPAAGDDSGFVSVWLQILRIFIELCTDDAKLATLPQITDQ
jgi:hypothetical protein